MLCTIITWLALSTSGVFLLNFTQGCGFKSHYFLVYFFVHIFKEKKKDSINSTVKNLTFEVVEGLTV